MLRPSVNIAKDSQSGRDEDKLMSKTGPIKIFPVMFSSRLTAPVLSMVHNSKDNYNTLFTLSTWYT